MPQAAVQLDLATPKPEIDLESLTAEGIRQLVAGARVAAAALRFRDVAAT